jgi:hypothetical protein
MIAFLLFLKTNIKWVIIGVMALMVAFFVWSWGSRGTEIAELNAKLEKAELINKTLAANIGIEKMNQELQESATAAVERRLVERNNSSTSCARYGTRSMKKTLTLLALCLTPFALTACSENQVPSTAQIKLSVPQSILNCKHAPRSPGASANAQQRARYILALYDAWEDCNGNLREVRGTVHQVPLKPGTCRRWPVHACEARGSEVQLQQVTCHGTRRNYCKESPTPSHR